MEQRRDAYNRRNAANYRSAYIGDNLARNLEDPFVPDYARPETQRKRRTAVNQRRRTRVTALDIFWISVGLIIVVTALMLMLTTINTTNTLNKEIAGIEVEIDAIKTDNDAREYAIESSVDLDYVSQVATDELGMVRSSISQIVTYDPQETEYIQQVAEIPNH